MAIKDIFVKVRTTDRKKIIKNVVRLGVVVLVIYYAGLFAYDYFERSKIYSSGTIEAVETDVATKVPGRVLSFLATEGDTINKGTIIASLETSELYAGFKQTVAVEKSAQIRFENAKRNYLRSSSLRKKKIISAQDFDAVTSNYEASESDLNRASAARAVAEISYNETNIKAPITGTILTKAVEVGDLLSPYSIIVTMADLSKLEMMIYVSETKYGKIDLGDVAHVTVDSFPGKRFEGRVIKISNKAEFTPKNIQTKEERVTQVFGIKIEIPNPDLELKPGMPADAVIDLTSK